MSTEKAPSKNHRSAKGADVIDVADATKTVVGALGKAADKAAKWTPQSLVHIMCLILLACLVGAFAAMLLVNQSQSEARDHENRDAQAAQIREANSREELRSIHCAQEAEKVRRDAKEESEKARRDAKELVKMVLESSVSENEKARSFQASESAKFRQELIAAIKAK